MNTAFHNGKEHGEVMPFLQRATKVVKKHLTDPDFRVDEFARELNISRMHLHRKLKQTAGQSAREFIRHLRLKYAFDLLQQEDQSVTQICYDSGFNHPSYFARCFKAKYGMLPSQWLRKNQEMS